MMTSSVCGVETRFSLLLLFLFGLVWAPVMINGNQSQQSSDGEIFPDFETDSEWSPQCCILDGNGPIQVPGYDFLTYRVQECHDTRNESTGEEERTRTTAADQLTTLSWMPRLSKLDLCQDGKFEYNLNINMDIALGDIVEKRLTEVEVTFSAPRSEGANQHYYSPVCLQFAFSVNQSRLPDEPHAYTEKTVSVTYICLAHHLSEGKFSMQITSFPWLQQWDYRIVWHYYNDYTDEAIWDRQFMGVASSPSSNQIAVVFEPPKSSDVIEGFRLELFSSPTNELIQESMISPNRNNFVFDQVTDGRYWVMLTPHGSICKEIYICPSISSQEVLVYADPRTSQVKTMMNYLNTNQNAAAVRNTTDSDDVMEYGRKLALFAGLAALILCLIAVVCAFIVWQFHQRRRTIPTLHLICAHLSPLEMKAAQHLAMALSTGFRLPVTLTCIPSASFSTTDRLILMVEPDHDSSTHCEEMTKGAYSKHIYSKKDIITVVSFSHTQNDFHNLLNESPSSSSDYFQTQSFLETVAGIPFKYFNKITFIHFTNQPQPPSSCHQLLHSVSRGSDKSEWDDMSSFSDLFQLRPSSSKSKRSTKKSKKRDRNGNSDMASVCEPDTFCSQKLLSSGHVFHLPHQSYQLYSHLTTKVYSVSPGHNIISAEDISSHEKWVAVQTLAKTVLESQSLFLRGVRSEDIVHPGTYDECETIGRISLCSISIDLDLDDLEDLKSHEDQEETDARLLAEQEPFPNEALHIIHPPRGAVPRTECFDFKSDCDSYSNFSEMRRDIFS